MAKQPKPRLPKGIKRVYPANHEQPVFTGKGHPGAKAVWYEVWYTTLTNETQRADRRRRSLKTATAFAAELREKFKWQAWLVEVNQL